jgi:hypothetical protein
VLFYCDYAFNMNLRQLRDIWLGEAATNGGVGNVEVLSPLSKATFDIIGLAGRFIVPLFRIVQLRICRLQL